MGGRRRRQGLRGAGAKGEAGPGPLPARPREEPRGPGLPLTPFYRGGRSGGHGAAPSTPAAAMSHTRTPPAPGFPIPEERGWQAPPPPHTHSMTRATAARRKAGSKCRSTGSHRSSGGLSRLTLHNSGAAAGRAGAAATASHSGNTSSSPHSWHPRAAARPMALDAATAAQPGRSPLPSAARTTPHRPGAAQGEGGRDTAAAQGAEGGDRPPPAAAPARRNGRPRRCPSANGGAAPYRKGTTGGSRAAGLPVCRRTASSPLHAERPASPQGPPLPRP